MLVNLKKLFSKDSSIGRFEYLKVILGLLVFPFILFSLAIITPYNVLFYPFSILAILALAFYLIVSYTGLYKRIKNIFDNAKISIPLFVVILGTIIVRPLHAILKLVLLFIPGKKESDKIVSNKLLWIGFPISAFIFIFIEMFTLMHMKGESMAFTIYPHDWININPFVKVYNRGDIIAHKYASDSDPYYIRRIVALPGEKVEIKKDADGATYIFIDDQKLEENYVKDAYKYPECAKDSDPADTKSMKCGPITIPKDSYYVLGDNRETAYDSRYYGPISKKMIKGRASHIILPFARRHTFQAPVYEDGKTIDNQDIATYMGNMQKKIKENWTPPKNIEKYETATVSYRIHKNGKITNIKIVKSSGNKLLNKSAVNALKTIKKFAPLPEAIPHKYIEIEYDFSYDGQP